MKNDTEYPFTAAQFNSLSEAERQAVLAVAEYLTNTTTEITDEDLSMAVGSENSEAAQLHPSSEVAGRFV